MTQILAPYGVSKTALLGLVKSLVEQCASKKVRVNAIAPGIIKTKFSEPVSFLTLTVLLDVQIGLICYVRLLVLLFCKL
jgi:NAD(P)-dependent dehydrogenase (short-subunit alcohol dehydrogenase family)